MALEQVSKLKIGENLYKITDTDALHKSLGYSANGKNYPIQDSDGKLYVNIPWTDTTYDVASTTANGLMSANDKILINTLISKINSLENQVNILSGNLICKYNVTSTSSSIKLYDSLSYTSMKIDGVEVNPTSTYSFNTTGEHTVAYILSNPSSISIWTGDQNNSELTSVTTGNTSSLINDDAFTNCINLISVIIPDSVTSIGDNAFSGCSGLTSVTMSNSINSIGDSAFFECTNLTSINIPNNVTIINDNAFEDCLGLTSITIGNLISIIGVNAFNGCSNLISITCNANTAPTVSNNTFQDVGLNGTLIVPNSSTGYDIWMGTGNYYLGKYGWTKVEQ